ncbi:DUF2479 domain-containing protein (plasmid) [Bacillus mycoides]|nr:DUF2479 domain-containing protein [Bacillus mycoides]
MQYKDFATKEEELKVMRFYQNDLNSAKLLINVTHDKVVTDFSTATKVQVAFQKPDGKRVFQDVQNVNQMQGKYYVVLSTQTLIAYGNVVAQLRLTFPNNKVIETCKFVFAVDESIMSDNAMESTNEFPVIQKAIEAGKKLEGVDIDGIIAAGSKADAALPKAGGTMTGNVNFNVAGSSKRIEFSDGANKLFGLYSDPNKFLFQDLKNNTAPWEYSHATQEFKVNGLTNLVKTNQIYTGWLHSVGTTKQLTDATDLNTITDSGIYGGTKLVNAPDSGYFYVEVIKYNDAKYTLQRATTLAGGGTNQGTWVRRLENSVWGAWERLIDSKGGTVTGNMLFDVSTANKYIGWRKADGKQHYIYGGDDVVGLFSEPAAKTPWRYTPSTDTFDVNSNTNLIKKAGDTMTGHLAFEVGAGASRAVRGTIGSTLQSGILFEQSGFQGYDWLNNRPIFRYLQADNTFTVNANFKTAKDGRASLTLTADAELVTSYGVIADRRGNTVTLRAPIRRKVGSTNGAVFTLPADMRPTMMLTQVVHASDGTPALMTIPSDTGVVMLQTITPPIMGKDYHIVLTYVTD